ncbi:MAG: serine/threonine-protein kinase [Acidobacteriota bacterium]
MINDTLAGKGTCFSMVSQDLDLNVRACVSCRRCYASSIQFCLDCFVELVNIELIPFVIDARYQLVKVISRGGMGVVFSAHDRDTGNEVAIKIFRSSAMADPRAQDRFGHEVQFATQLEHPSVAATYGKGELSDASAYVVTELVNGPTLRAEMERAGKMPIATGISILVAVAEGLNAAHQAGLVHRDLKPESIIITSAPGESQPQIKIVNFSFARIAIGRRFVPGTTGRLQGKGVLPLRATYLSPEQFRGEEVDLRSDIFSLGVIAYEMFAGKPPFTAKRTGDFAAKLLTERPPSLRSLNAEVNVLLQAEILRSLEKEPRQRHQSAAEFKRALLSAQQLGLRIVE